MSIDAMRRDYAGEPLDYAAIQADPLSVFQAWFADAQRADPETANAMSLATVDERGRPAVRVVLLKGIDAEGLRFFTNYKSKKAQQLRANPFAAVALYWRELDRQIRAEGTVLRLSREDSEAYFRTRPRGSQLAAAVSPQSTAIGDRAELVEQMAALDKRLGDDPVPLPDHWGGYRMVVEAIEFWQGQPDRCHDRVRCECRGGSWFSRRLAP